MPFKSQDDNIYSFTVKLRDDSKDFRLDQDVSAYKQYAANSRLADSMSSSKRQYRSWCIVPDIVAIDILTKYGLDIHAPDFMSNEAALRRFKRIIHSEYPELLTANISKV